MIKSKKDLQYYLERDAYMLDRPKSKPRLIHDDMWKYQILMRKCEYYQNCKNHGINKIILKLLKFRYTYLGRKCGFEIPLNVFEEGLAIAHCGPIIVNCNARVGKNCRIHEGTTIGAKKYGSTQAPIIGDNVYISTGVKIIGKVKIADGVVIGANAVVVKDISESSTTWAGVPAKKVSDNGSDDYLAHKKTTETE